MLSDHELGSTGFGLRTGPVLPWRVVITFADVTLVGVRAGCSVSAISVTGLFEGGETNPDTLCRKARVHQGALHPILTTACRQDESAPTTDIPHPPANPVGLVSIYGRPGTLSLALRDSTQSPWRPTLTSESRQSRRRRPADVPPRRAVCRRKS